MADDEIKTFMRSFMLNDDQLLQVYKRFCAQLRRGLNRDTNPSSDLKCIITHVHGLPTGEEDGKYIGLDWKIHQIRIVLLTVKKNHSPKVNLKIYSMRRVWNFGDSLFNYIAECLDDFMREHEILGQPTPLAMTFPFPCSQESVVRAKFLRWTKGIQKTDLIGEDIAEKLTNALFQRSDSGIEVMAIQNNTTGSLMTAAYFNPYCRIAVVINNGTNACYWENVKCVNMLDEEIKEKHKNVVINTEWAALGDHGCLDFIRTEVDNDVDSNSNNPRQQIFEKLVAGNYLGQILKYALLAAIRQDLIFSGHRMKEEIMETLINIKGLIDSRILIDVDMDETPDLRLTKASMKLIFEYNCMSMRDARRIKFICHTIKQRAAYLTGVLVSALINKINHPKIAVAIDGIVFKNHPKFEAFMREKMRLFVNPHIEFDIVLSEDGSGFGAALLASVAENIRIKENLLLIEEEEKRKRKSNSSGYSASFQSTARECDEEKPIVVKKSQKPIVYQKCKPGRLSVE